MPRTVDPYALRRYPPPTKRDLLRIESKVHSMLRRGEKDAALRYLNGWFPVGRQWDPGWKNDFSAVRRVERLADFRAKVMAFSPGEGAVLPTMPLEADSTKRAFDAMKPKTD